MKDLKRKLREGIARLVKAEVADSWLGGRHPSEWPAIEEELQLARRRVALLLSLVDDLEKKADARPNPG